MVEQDMTIEQFQNTTQKQNNINTLNIENNNPRNDPLYKGRLSYVKEVILCDCPDIDPNDLSEKLDVSINIAKMLLLDCKKK